ncbi:MAG: cation diffusion facilitator family transporter [Alphaproteobacteria bacterium]|nr:cation diffusion facilitator family transporter [Alphaproteobacteria bacterium]
MTDHHHEHSGLEPSRRVRGAALLAIAAASVMIVMKGTAWLMTGSTSMLGAFLDSLMDLSLSVMNFFAIRHAQTPADEEHRFGHGKAEALAALAQGAMLSLAALFLLYEAVQAFLTPRLLTETGIGVGVIVISIVLTFGLVQVQKRTAKATNSVAIEADSAHYEGDIYINLGVLAALILSGPLSLPYADPAVAVLVALLLANSARQIFASAGNQLMDRELDDDMRDQIKGLILAHPDVRGLHDLRTRQAGLSRFVQCHIELDGDITLNQAHEISDAVEANVMAEFPDVEVLIHQDPLGHEDLTDLEKS